MVDGMSALPRSAWSRLLRRETQISLDLVVLALAFALAYLLRFEFQIPGPIRHAALVQLPLVLLVQVVAAFAAGIYSYVWRYVGLAEIRGFLAAAALSATPLLLARFLLPESLALWRVPLSVIIMDTGLAFAGLLGVRVLRRIVWERHERAPRDGHRRRRRALLVGAGHAGIVAARELGGPQRELDVVGFVDDAPDKQGASIQGIRVLGPIPALEGLLVAHSVEEVVVTMTQASGDVVREVVETCKRAGITARIIPSLHEILVGRVSVGRLREVQIEDLLGRDPVRLDEAPVREVISGEVVVITGAGGSIGSELARQVARFGPARLVLVDRAEPALFEIDWELRRLWPELVIESHVVDCGSARMAALIARLAPRLVLHAAAHKHVPLMEANPIEAADNNVLATHRLLEACGTCGVERFVLVSTDKAVRPRSIMGASKRAAELVVQAGPATTRAVAVRFGNVLGSTGSVIPIFRRQIEAGGPLTVTDPEMERYFMTIPEAAQLVLQAGAIGTGGEIFVLDMGKPVRILDLARDMIRLAGLIPDQDVRIEISGVRPGEKIREELEHAEGELRATGIPKLSVTTAAPPASAAIASLIAMLEAAVASGDATRVRELLQEAGRTG